jgi:phosphotransferase system HPr-like phosphotransfer protein
MKYKIFLISIFIIMPLLAYSQIITLKITGEGEALIGAHVYKNSKIATATNANGIAAINANAGDKLTISHIGYNTETVDITQKMISNGNITVYMQPKVFGLEEAKVTRAKSDMNILKAKLKKGLKLRVSPNKINFTEIDTLFNKNEHGRCLSTNGNAVFMYTGMEPMIKITSIKLLSISKDYNDYADIAKFEEEDNPHRITRVKIADSMRLEKNDTLKSHITKRITTQIGNSLHAAYHIYKFRKMKVFYRGKENNKDIFYFSSISKNDKVDGLVYLDEHGVIERINNNYTSSTSKYTTYHLDTYFEYFSNDNTILPKSCLRKSYILNNNLKIVQINYKSLELFHKNE